MLHLTLYYVAWNLDDQGKAGWRGEEKSPLEQMDIFCVVPLSIACGHMVYWKHTEKISMAPALKDDHSIQREAKSFFVILVPRSLLFWSFLFKV